MNILCLHLNTLTDFGEFITTSKKKDRLNIDKQEIQRLAILSNKTLKKKKYPPNRLYNKAVPGDYCI